ncbi:helix-turn-helix transcriptional regulator [Pyxidicoccus xibeiensis]|uniref:helix-turn-helix transcriptional regulator n=1 Tax=Pyxidicoccus xibeiensis TaxID=2906759 RepID=UPI0020A7C861|nr:AraC family transcriptional regulator [Pyxidicoccus xibeiensis]MCP3141842.1 helix-turn-helix transcriptional regulator [Pyxidicoccus xibeiensis]
MTWDLALPLRPLLEGQELFVGEWTCKGLHTARWREQTRYHEVDLLRTGAHLRTLGRREHVVDATTAALQSPDDEYWMTAPTLRPQVGTLILLRGGLAEELVPRLRARVCHLSSHAARLHFQLMRATDPLAREEAALAVVHRVVADSRAAPEERSGGSAPAWRQLAEELQHLMATRFHERLTLETMAAEVGASPFHASRVFRAVTGETLHRHLTRVRLRAGLFELQHAAGRLIDVALAVGFSSHSHFTSAFRREYGCAPSALVHLHAQGAVADRRR